MNKLFYVIVLSMLVHIGIAQEWIQLEAGSQPKAPEITLLTNTLNEIRFKVNITGFYNETISTNLGSFNIISLPEYVNWGEVSKPSLPSITESLCIPQGKEYTVAIEDVEWTNLLGYNIFPTQKTLEESEIDTNFYYDATCYNTTNIYPNVTTNIGPLGIWKGVHNISVSTFPFEYNTGSGQLAIMKTFTVKVSLTGVSSKSAEIIDYDDEDAIMFQRNFVNFDPELAIVNSYKSATLVSESDGYDYLIVTAPEYIDSEPLNNFVRWKKQLGYKTKIVSTDETGTAPEEVFNYIQGEYSTNHSIQNLLLIGDDEDIPSVYRSVLTGNSLEPTKSATGDYWCGCTDGSSDFQAEINVGRFAISNQTELSNIVNKTILYEGNPEVSNWVDKCLVVANQEAYVYDKCESRVKLLN